MNKQFPPAFLATMPKDSTLLFSTIPNGCVAMTTEQILQQLAQEYVKCQLQMKKTHLENLLNMYRGKVPEYRLRNLQLQYVQCIWEMSD
jgi:hypothetical protein